MDPKTIQNQINVFVQATIEKMHVQKIVQYGSTLQKNSRPRDIDLIVVGNFPEKDTEGFLYDIYTSIPRMIDFHVYGVRTNSKSIAPFLRQALEEGKIIYSA